MKKNKSKKEKLKHEHEQFVIELMACIKASLAKNDCGIITKAFCVVALKSLLDNSLEENFKDNKHLQSLVTEVIPANIMATACFFKHEPFNSDWSYIVGKVQEELTGKRVEKLVRKIEMKSVTKEHLLIAYFHDVNYEDSW